MNKGKTYTFFTLIVNLLLLVYILFIFNSPPHNKTTPNTLAEVRENTDSGIYLVTRVIDGDTIELEGGNKVRYIGIDTPERSQGLECFAMESYAKNRDLVEGKKVRIEKDISENDKYKRLLRYVWIQNTQGQEILVNEILVREGYATVSTYPPDVKYQLLFLDAQKDAREDNRGLWGNCM